MWYTLFGHAVIYGGDYAMSTLSGPDDHYVDERAILCRRGGGVALPPLR